MDITDIVRPKHYNTGVIETIELIKSSMSIDEYKGYLMGNILKYAQRYGKKDGYNRKDLLKVLHYAIMALYVHDEERGEDETIKTYN